MSERLNLWLGDKEFESTPENTTLFTFLGRSAIRGIELDHARFNHIFFETGETAENTMSGSYLFRTDRNEETFDSIMGHIAQYDYPMMLNRRDVPECDVNAYYNMLDRYADNSLEDLGDYLPESWA